MVTVFFVLTVILPVAIWDVRYYRVPNMFIVLGMALGVCHQWNIAAEEGMLNWLGGFMIPLVLLWGLHRRHMIGAGDVKVLCVVGGYYGITLGVPIWIASFLVGAVFSIIKMIRTHLLKSRLQYLAMYLSKNKEEQLNEAYYCVQREGRDMVIPFSAVIGAVVFCYAITEIL